MITLHIGKLLENEGFGTLFVTGKETNPSIFVERITLDGASDSHNGIWLESRGFPLARGTRQTAAFDIFARDPSPLNGANKLKEIRKYLTQAYSTVCELPIINGVSEDLYTNVTIQPTSNIENVGTDSEGRVVWVMSAQVAYTEPTA